MADIELLNAKTVKKRTRQTVDLPCVLDQRLTELAFEHGMSKSDVIRDAVKLLVEYDRLRKEGYDTVSQKQNSDGTKELVRVSIGV
jgi:metal-responsive CopG/Arc/MetJ family transcriptional regulator